jgi:DNA-binding CsgD family transcriptional regulator
MKFTDAFDAHRMIDLIYEASLDLKGWTRVADALGRMIGGSATLLVSTSGGLRPLPTADREACLPSDREMGWGEDLSIARLRNAETGTALFGRRTEVLPGCDPAETGGSSRSSYCTVLWRDTRRSVVLAVVAAEGVDGFPEAQLRRLDALRPHFVRALGAYGRLAEVETERDASLAALDRASVGLLIVTANGTIRFSSALAEARLTGAGLVRRNDKVDALSNGSSRSLQRAIAAATGDAASSLVRLSTGVGAEGPAITVLPWRIGEETLAMLLLTVEQSAPDDALLRDNYGLTTSEGRLLGALVSGERLAEYAERTGVQISTAKTHLRSLFCKTGERRQADLVRRALTDPALRFSLAAS